MLCHQLHQETAGCLQPIAPDSSWKYCPLCGRSTGCLLLEEARFSVPFRQLQPRAVTLRNPGISPITASFELLPALDGLAFSPGQARSLTLAPGERKQINLQIPPLETAQPLIGYLVIGSNDSPAVPGSDPWRERPRRIQRLSLSAEVDAPAHVLPLQEAVLFRPGLSERSVEIENTGRAPAEIVEIRCPAGYSVSQRTGVVPGESVRAVTVRRDWAASAGAREELTFCLEGGDSFTVFLYSEEAGAARELHRAVIGIDFGTTFTSIAFRNCLHLPDRQDEVTFLHPPGEESNRFPTRVWVGLNGEFAFGSAATLRYNNNPSPDAGFLFRELKTLLRDPAGAQVHPEKFRDAALRFVLDRYGEQWTKRLVSEYLAWIYQSTVVPELRRRFETEQVDVRYQFSLPVLDYSHEAGEETREVDLQRSGMEAALQNAGFPMDQVEFQFEPVCAAIGLLYPTDRATWPRLGGPEYPVKDGDTIVVFDSGGGTTDVVLARIEIEKETGRLALEVEGCLGVGSSAETFGGEMVTSRMLEAFRNPTTVGGARDWFQGDLNLKTLLGQNREELSDLVVRDSAERLKTELATSIHRSVQRGNTLLSPRLLSKITLPFLESLRRELIDRLFQKEAPSKIRFYLSVGGNTSLEVLQVWIESFMGDESPAVSRRRLSLPNGYRQLAVAYGAAWVPDARLRNLIPYDLQLVVEPSSLSTALTLRKQTAQEQYRANKQYELPPREKLVFRLIAGCSDGPHSVAAAAAANPYNEKALLEADISVQNGIITVTGRLTPPNSAEPGERKTLIIYRM